MLPFDDWFGIVLLQVTNFVVYQLVIISFVRQPADQFSLFEIFYGSYIHFSINFGAPLLVGLQVNQP